MIGVEDWAEIRRLHRAEGLSINEIVRRRGLARNTVRAALRSERPPLYERKSKGSIVDAAVVVIVNCGGVEAGAVRLHRRR